MFDLVGKDPVFQMLESTMDLASTRHTIVASNIANVDTPGYKALDIDFEKELRVAVESSERTADEAPGAHARFTYQMVLSPRVFEVNDAAPRQDGNTVDIDSQLGKLAKSGAVFTRAATLYAHKIRMLKAALQENG